MHSRKMLISFEYCRLESFVAFFYFGMFLVFDTFAVSFAIWLFPNKYQLPMNYRIVGIDFDSISWRWAINYALQVPMLYFSTNFYTIYFFATLILANHLSWMVDCSLIDIESLDTALDAEDVPAISKKLRKVTKVVQYIVSWQRKTNVFLQFSFLAIFVSQSSLSCFYIFALSNNPSDSFLAMFGMVFTLTELYTCCWTGSRVAQKLKRLTTALHCIHWDKLCPNHRKHLTLVLLITQNIRGYHGIFKSVELMTFLEVI